MSIILIDTFHHLSIIISLYWTPETLFSPSITTSEYLICNKMMYHILLETDWWALPNASSIVQIRSAIHEILADKAFTATDGLIPQSLVVTFVHPTYMRIALIWSFSVQLSLWKSVHNQWRYKLNEVCDTFIIIIFLYWTSEPPLSSSITTSEYLICNN